MAKTKSKEPKKEVLKSGKKALKINAPMVVDGKAEDSFATMRKQEKARNRRQKQRSNKKLGSRKLTRTKFGAAKTAKLI